MATINANGINIFYETHGNGIPLILISGLGGDHLSVWDQVLKIFSPNYKTIVFDNRGIGKTDTPDGPYSIETMADDVAALMNELNIKKAHIVGFSMGGQIAFKLAEKYSDKVIKLIMCVCPATINMHARMFLDTVVNLWQDETPSHIIDELILPWILSDDYLEKNYQAILAKRAEPFTVKTYQGFKSQYEAYKSFDADSVLHTKITMPTLFIGGGKDLLCLQQSVEDFSKRIPHAKLIIFPDAGHLVSNEQPEDFAKAVLEFLG